MLETKGPEIRSGVLKENKPVELTEGQELEIVTDYAIEGDSNRITCNYKQLPATVEIGSIVFLDGGAITTEVIEVLDVRSSSIFPC